MLSDRPGNKRTEYVADYVVFDLETTGTSCAYDAVIEISAVKVCGGAVVDEFTTLVDPERPIPYWASQVNGITDSMVRGAPLFEDALRDFLDFAGDMVLVGHNIHAFDMKFLVRDAQRFWGTGIGNDTLDTLSMSRRVLPDLKHHKLTDLAEYYGISSEGAHRALNDCRMNQQVFECMAHEVPKSAAELPVCPTCGRALKKRSGRFGSFWGCTGYPECRYTRNA